LTRRAAPIVDPSRALGLQCRPGYVESIWTAVPHTLFARARHALAVAALAAAVLPACSVAARADATAAASASGWDAAQQRQVLAAGLMSDSGGSFEGAAPLAAVQANAAMAALADRLPNIGGDAGLPTEMALPVSQSPVTVAGFDRMLVEELGLTSVAAHVQATAATAGLRPPSYFGSEVVARFLELRYEHPVGAQRLDLFPEQPITRAEAAWSLDRVLSLGEWSIAGARETLSTFELAQMSGAQRQALQIAVSRIGYPYVWGGTTDNTADGLEHGGFDCSGFAWRVYKVSGLSWGNEIKGRTAAEQAGEIPHSQRLRISQLQPGDLLFFGSAHFDSTATERNVIHEGIYLGENWVIHSSGQGVYVPPLSGSWLGSSFAWGRRVIR
jgi:cell wall-associated NlpC family hydrolase